MAIALAKLAEEDPTFKTYTDQETGQTIIAGMGELHLEIIVDRLLREFKVEANVGKPAGCLQGDHPQEGRWLKARIVRQTGGHGQYGHCQDRVSSRTSPARATSSSNDIVGGADPEGIHSRLSTRVFRARAKSGVLAGYRLWWTSRRLLYDGSYHEVDSSEMAFKIAGSMAFKDALEKANPVLMEPMMKVDDHRARTSTWATSSATCPARRGRIEGMETAAAPTRLSTPMSRCREMFGYATDLRSRTQGRGHVHHAVRPLRGSAEVHRGKGHRRTRE